jgi:hypothetical protein
MSGGGLPSASGGLPLDGGNGQVVRCRAGGFDGLQGEHPRSIKSCFSGFIHFPRKRTLTGWGLLFAMGKVTSDDFLYGRKHSRISKCRKTRTKVRSKSGQKWVSRVQSRWVQNDEMSILPGFMVGEKRVQKRPQNDGQKYVQNRIQGEGANIAFQ